MEGFSEMDDKEKSEIKSLIKEFLSPKSPVKQKQKAKKKVEPGSGGGRGTDLLTSTSWG